MTMKRVSLILTLILILSLSMSLIACNIKVDPETGVGTITGELTKLSTPTNVRVEDDIIKWSSVQNAGSYIVQIGDESHQAKTSYLEYPISSLLSSSASGLYVKVKALPISSILYSESDWSELYGPVDYVASVKEFSGEPLSNDEQNAITETKNTLFKRNYVIPKKETDTPTFGFSSTYYDYDGYVISMYYLGQIQNVLIDNEFGIVLYDSSIGTVTKKVTRTYATEEHIESAVNKASSQATSTEYIKNWKLGGELTIGRDSWPVKGTITAEVGGTNTTGTTYTTTFSESYLNASKTSMSISNEITINFSPSTHKSGAYRFVVVSNVEVYGIYAYDINTNEAYFDTRPYIRDVREAFQFDETGEFLSEADDILIFNEEIYNEMKENQSALENKYRNKVYFDLNGGIGQKEMEYLYNGCEQDLPFPKKENYVFLGWHLNGVYHNKIKSTDCEDLYLKAVWYDANISFEEKIWEDDKYSSKYGFLDKEGRLGTYSKQISIPKEMQQAMKDGLININIEASFYCKIKTDGKKSSSTEVYLTIDGNAESICKANAKGKQVLWTYFSGSWGTASGNIKKTVKLKNDTITIGAIYYCTSNSNKDFKQAYAICNSLKIYYSNDY